MRQEKYKEERGRNQPHSSYCGGARGEEAQEELKVCDTDT